jgi:hypothetical protein
LSQDFAPMETIRAALGSAVMERTYRAVAGELQMSPSGLKKILDGGSPSTRTLVKLRAWYRRFGDDAEPASDYWTGYPRRAAAARRTAAAATNLPSGIAHLLGILGSDESPDRIAPRNRRPTRRGPDQLTLSVEFPDWIDEDSAAETLAELIVRLSALHVALGGGGLELDGIEAGTPSLAHL